MGFAIAAVMDQNRALRPGRGADPRAAFQDQAGTFGQVRRADAQPALPDIKRAFAIFGADGQVLARSKTMDGEVDRVIRPGQPGILPAIDLQDADAAQA